MTAQLAGILHSAMDAIVTIDESRRILLFNPAAEKMFLLSAEDVVGQPIDFLIPERFHEAHRENIRAFGETGENDRKMGESGTVTGRRANGEEFPIEASISKVITNDKPFYTAILRDVSERRQVEAVLRESESQFRALFENLINGFILYKVILDEDNQPLDLEYLEVNVALEKQIGLRREELIGSTLSRVFPGIESLEPNFIDVLGNVGMIGKSVKLDFYFEPLEKWFSITSYCPKLGYVAVVSDDITERKQAEAALRESERRFRRLAENAPDVIYRYRLTPTPGFEYVSPAVTALTGYTPEEHYSDPYLGFKLIHVDDRHYLESMMREVALMNAPLTLRWVKKDGTVIWTEQRNLPVTDEDGNIIAVEGIARDVTERKRTENKLKQYAARLEALHQIDRAILNAQSPTAVARATLHDVQRLIPCQRISVTLFDLVTHEMSILAELAPEDASVGEGTRFPLEAFNEALDKLKQEKVYKVQDISAIPNPPSKLHKLKMMGFLSVLSAPLISRGELIGSLNLWADRVNVFEPEHVEIACEVADQLAVAIQNARLLEQVQHHALELEQTVAERTAELQEINAELEAFSYSVSHDLQTPLRTINALSSKLLKNHTSGLREEGQDYLRGIQSASRRMSSLIESLLELSRVGRYKMKIGPVNLSGLVQDVIEELRWEQPKPDATVQVAEGIMAKGDVRLLHIALKNLLSNAWKFTGKQAKARIKFGVTEQDERAIYFVRDNGVGFEMAYADKLFVPFQRLHSSAQFEGSGIGLATTQRIIHRHGGQIWVEAEPGRGATFYFTLRQ